jgi:NADH:ubiquinone oxidoreductase subunit 4 (subunit M)
MVNNFFIFCTLLGLFLTLVYSLFIYTRISTGLIRVSFIRFYADLTRREFYYVLPLLFFVIYFGLFPNVLFDYSFASLFFWIFGV